MTGRGFQENASKENPAGTIFKIEQ